MSILPANQAQLIAFVIQNASGVEITGLGSSYTLQLSKNGGAFAASTGVKAEIGSGWYTYELTAGETDTAGPLAIQVTAAGADPLNLLYEIRPYSAEEPAGATILTASEAANVLRCLTTDTLMLQLLPQVDDYIQTATGRDWAADTTIHPIAKAAAQMLLTMWHENPSMIGNVGALPGGLSACLTQLEAMAQYYYTFEGLESSGYIGLRGIREGDTVVTLIGRVGASGDQSAKFEHIISVDGYIRQTSSEDLSEKWFTAYLKPPQEM